jgi:hypothetical protein
MENTGWLWGKLILENSKALGSKLFTGVKDASIYVAGKTKEGALYVAEKSKEGVSYIAEKTKPATDKIKEGAGYIGSQVKYTYENVKMKISKGKKENNSDDINGKNMEIDNDVIGENGEKNLYKSLIEAESSNYSEIKN